MSNFGQSSLGSTKAGARSEHEDSDRGKCFVPAQIRSHGKTTKRSLRPRRRRRRGEKKREERKEKGRERKKKNEKWVQNSWIGMCHGFQCMHVNVY